MIRVKCFEKNKDGKIEFTQEQLQALLNEAYECGREDGATCVTIPFGRWNDYWYSSSVLTATNAVGTTVVSSNESTSPDVLEIRYGRNTTETKSET